MSCWPTLSFLLFAVPYNYAGSVSRQIEWASLSLWLCAVLSDQWASQLIPSLVFVELWNVCCWWTRPSAAFLFARSRLCSAWGRLVDPRLFKVIRVTVHKINRLLLLPLLPRLLASYSSIQSFPVCLNGKNIGWINRSNNQCAQGSRQDRVPGRNNPMGLTDQVLCLERPKEWQVIRDYKIIIGIQKGKNKIISMKNNHKQCKSAGK